MTSCFLKSWPNLAALSVSGRRLMRWSACTSSSRCAAGASCCRDTAAMRMPILSGCLDGGIAEAEVRGGAWQAHKGWSTPAETSALKDELKKAKDEAGRKANMLISLRKGLPLFLVALVFVPRSL